ncbi:MAG TPA: hypothetical protein VHF89_13265 [Solirubrobacteraceae bacterium]|nr:hypothetical protein [Solirubrobacteraceae bacterium]
MTPPLVPPTGPDTPTGPHGPRPAQTPEPGGFAQVYDLALARARRTDSPADPVPEPVIPVSVLEEMEAASRMFHALHAQGHELRFEQEGSRVRAELRTVDGEVVRPVSLREAVDVNGGPDFAA